MDPLHPVALAFLGILVTFLMWKLRNFMKLYADFPSYPILYHMVTASLKKFQLHIPLHVLQFPCDSELSSIYGHVCSRIISAVSVQAAVKASERFQKEGMFLVWLFHPYLFIFSEEAVKIFSNAIQKPYKYEVLKDGFGTGIVTRDSEAWWKQHKMLYPAFHIGMLKRKLHIFNENAEILIKNLAESVNNPYIDIFKCIQLCTFSIIFEYSLELKMNCPEEKQLLENLAGLISDLGKLLADRLVNPLYHYKFIMNITPSGWKQRKIISEVNDITKKIITEMKIKVNQESKILDSDYPDDVQEQRKSFANILLDQHLKDPTFTMEDIEDQVKTILTAGYDTSSHTIQWCLFMLALHPDIQDQVYNEVEYLPKGHIKYEDLLHLKYLDCVIKETLRLFPAVPIFGRRLTEDIQCGKYLVPKETTITFFPYALHRNPNIFPEPETFNPDRFMDENREKLLWNFIPFAAGPRQCLGKRFAMLEMKVILAHILRHFQIKTLDRREEIEVSWEIALVPAKSPRFLLLPRSEQHI